MLQASKFPFNVMSQEQQYESTQRKSCMEHNAFAFSELSDHVGTNAGVHTYVSKFAAAHQMIIKSVRYNTAHLRLSQGIQSWAAISMP